MRDFVYAAAVELGMKIRREGKGINRAGILQSCSPSSLAKKGNGEVATTPPQPRQIKHHGYVL